MLQAPTGTITLATLQTQLVHIGRRATAVMAFASLYPELVMLHYCHASGGQGNDIHSVSRT
jgi:hypothetical protein